MDRERVRQWFRDNHRMADESPDTFPRCKILTITRCEVIYWLEFNYNQGERVAITIPEKVKYGQQTD